MKQVKTILSEAIANMQLWLNVYNVQPINGGKYRLYVDRTWHVNNKMDITLGTVKCRVVNFALNQYIDVTAPQAVTVGKYKLPAPFFVHGKYKAVQDEISRKVNKETITPFFWLFENLQRTVPLSPTSAIDSEGDVRLFIMMSADFGNFTIAEHYTQVIEPIARNLYFELEAQLKKHRLVNNLTTSRVINHAKFTTGGGSIKDDGEVVFNTQLSGIESFIALQIRVDTTECKLPRVYIPQPLSLEIEISNGNEVEAEINTQAPPLSLVIEITNDNDIEAEIDVLATAPTITAVEYDERPTPLEFNQGETYVGVEIIGTNFTAITDNSQVSFGAGITVDSVVVVSDTLITCNVAVGLTADLGNKNVTVTFDNTDVASLNDVIEVMMTVQAIAYIAKVETETSTAVATTQRNAINYLYQGYRGAHTTNGSDLLALFDSTKHGEYPYLPNNDSTALLNSYKINMHNLNKNIIWVNMAAGDCTVLGMKGGATKYGNTQINQLNDIGTLSYGQHSYLREQNSLNEAECGALGGVSPFNGANIIPIFSTGDASYNGIFKTSTTQPTRTGLMSVQLSGGTQTKRRNGVTYNTDTNAGTAQNLEIFVRARNFAGNQNLNSTKQAASDHPATPVFTDAQAADHYQIWQGYHTLLNRQI